MPRTSKKTPALSIEHIIDVVKKPFVVMKLHSASFMGRRPHRSFRMTRRRDYKRSLKLPGYFAFSMTVTRTLWQHKKIFVWLAVVYAILTATLVGIGSQDTYTALSTTLQNASSQIFSGNIGQLGQAALIFVSISSSGLSATPSEAQQVYIVLLGLLIWLTTVWLLRNLLAGHKVKMRDGIYNAGAPIVASVIVAFIFLVQLVPIGLALVGYSAANASGLLNEGVAAMLFWFAATLLSIMSLYWITSTFFALIIVTLPGMYPMRALKTAGDMVVGRRLRILLRILWMIGDIFVVAAVVFIPIILIDTGLTHVWPAVSSAPIVPVALTLFSVLSFIWAASYIYLLYRRVVDDDAKPA